MAFTITLENRQENVIETRSFETKKEAKAEERRVKKEFNLINHAGHVFNPKAYEANEVFEMFTNY